MVEPVQGLRDGDRIAGVAGETARFSRGDGIAHRGMKLCAPDLLGASVSGDDFVEMIREGYRGLAATAADIPNAPFLLGRLRDSGVERRRVSGAKGRVPRCDARKMIIERRTAHLRITMVTQSARMRPQPYRGMVAEWLSALRCWPDHGKARACRCVSSRPHRRAGVIAPPVGESLAPRVKFDGYRIQVHKSGRDVDLLSRNGHHFTGQAIIDTRHPDRASCTISAAVERAKSVLKQR